MPHDATRPAGYLPLDVPRGIQLWDWADTLRTVELFVTNTSAEPQALSLRCEVFRVDKPCKPPEEHRAMEHLNTPANRMEWGSCNDRDRFDAVARAEAEALPHFVRWLPFSCGPELRMTPKDPTSDEMRRNLVLDPCPGVGIGTDVHHYDFALRLWRDPSDNEYHVAPDCHCFRISPAPPYGEAANIVNGHNRRYSTNPVNAWLSDVDEQLPQSMTLRLAEPKRIRRIHLTFDTLERVYREAPINCDRRVSPRCVADYTIATLLCGVWQTAIEVTDNHQRLRIHELQGLDAEAPRLAVQRVQSQEFGARVYEIRVQE